MISTDRITCPPFPGLIYLELLASRMILRLIRPNWRYITDSHEASRNSAQSNLRLRF